MCADCTGMMQSLKIVHWGLGAMGSGIAKLVNSKTGLESIAAFDRDPGKLGRDLGEIIGTEEKLGVNVTSPQNQVLMLPEPTLSLSPPVPLPGKYVSR